MAWTLCTSAAAISKAGAGANTTIIASGATLALWSDMAENFLNSISRYDWVTNIASVGAKFSGALAEVSSDMIAKKIINYDMSGYTSRMEATTMIDVLSDNIKQAIEIIRDQKYQEKMI